MRFLNPKTDLAFKRIFGSAESSDILISFLNAILALQAPHRIAEVDIIDPYLAPKIKGMKDTYLDVKAKDESGKSYIIEMQVLNVEGFEQRILYNACKAYAGQLDSGEAYHELTDVVAITITDFIMFPELSEVVNSFKLRAENGHVYHDDLKLVFAELPKFQKGESELINDLDRWFYFLKSASTLEAVPKSMTDNHAIQHAFRIANKAGLNRQELDDQEHREIFIQDQRGALSLAKKQGLQQGIKQGIEQGEHTAKLTIAQSLLDLLDDQAIANSTGLSLKKVEQLRTPRGSSL